MTTAVFVDVEQPVRDWLRDQSIVGVDDRVFIDLPNGVTYPCVSLALVDGGIDPSEAPVANALFSFSAWADDRPAAQAAIWSLVEILQTLRYADLQTLACYGAQIEVGPTPRPDPDGFPRFTLDARLALRVPQ